MIVKSRHSEIVKDAKEACCQQTRTVNMLTAILQAEGDDTAEIRPSRQLKSIRNKKYLANMKDCFPLNFFKIQIIV